MIVCAHKHYVKKNDHIDMHTCIMKKGHAGKHSDGRLTW